jgi:hypothetical protein
VKLHGRAGDKTQTGRDLDGDGAWWCKKWEEIGRGAVGCRVDLDQVGCGESKPASQAPQGFEKGACIDTLCRYRRMQQQFVFTNCLRFVFDIDISVKVATCMER